METKAYNIDFNITHKFSYCQTSAAPRSHAAKARASAGEQPEAVVGQGRRRVFRHSSLFRSLWPRPGAFEGGWEDFHDDSGGTIVDRVASA